jgi:predicted transcriptional regulator
MAGQVARIEGDLEGDILAVLSVSGQSMTLEQIRERLVGTAMCTTVLTALRRLEQQELIRREWVRRVFVYTATTGQAELMASRIQGLLDAAADRRAVLARFFAMLPSEDEQLFVDLLRARRPEVATR